MARVEIKLVMQDVEGGMPKVQAAGTVFTRAEGLAVGEAMEDMSQHEVMANICQAMMIHHLAMAQKAAKPLIRPAHSLIKA